MSFSLQYAGDAVWYGTFSPNQQEQLFFRWRKGPSTILAVFQNIIFILCVFLTVLLKTMFYVMPTFSNHHFWYPVFCLAAVCLSMFYIIPEAILMLLLASSTGLMVNHKAIESVCKDHDSDHHGLASDLLELSHIATIKEQLESDLTRDTYKKFLTSLYQVVFSEDEKELHRAGWKVHNWDTARGMRGEILLAQAV